MRLTPPVSPLSDRLTQRERLVLAHLPSRASNIEMAAKLEVSVDTLKTHLKHIYRKLNVSGRAHAISAAEQLGLL